MDAMKTQIFTSRDLFARRVRCQSRLVIFHLFFCTYFYFFIYGWLGTYCCLCVKFPNSTPFMTFKNVNVQSMSYFFYIFNFSCVFHFTVLQISKVNRKFCENLKRKLIQIYYFLKINAWILT